MDEKSSPDRGTSLEAIETLRDRYGDGVSGRADSGSANNRFTSVERLPKTGVEQIFRPTARPATPRLTILDDGELLSGEVVRLRDPVTVIGRGEVDVCLSHDALLSKRHAEVVRKGNGSHSEWILRDLGSANHTFVRCSTAELRSDRIIILGSRRFRFRPSGSAKLETHSASSGTRLTDVPGGPSGLWPALVDTRNDSPDGVITLRSSVVSIGRSGAGNDLVLDDPLIAVRHAVVTREPSGQWKIKALPSVNGVWIQIAVIRLSSPCRFQCGEQRFLFAI